MVAERQRYSGREAEIWWERGREMVGERQRDGERERESEREAERR